MKSAKLRYSEHNDYFFTRLVSVCMWRMCVWGMGLCVYLHSCGHMVLCGGSMLVMLGWLNGDDYRFIVLKRACSCPSCFSAHMLVTGARDLGVCNESLNGL
jgi:hypothetical protein